MSRSSKYVLFFSELGIEDVPRVGGKNASLGEMYRELTPLGIPVPDGFAITAEAYRDMLTRAGAWERLHALLDDFDKNRLDDLARRAQAARSIVYESGLPDALRVEILEAYHRLQAEYGPEMTVAVRSSATAEDLPHASFAGQHETYLNVSGDEMLLDACRRCFASIFTDRAISYRMDQGFDHFKVALSIGVQKMVRADLASSGVMFSLDTESGFRDVVFITGAYGLGENVVQGAVDPDEFYVHKPTFQQGYRAVLRRRLGRKQVKMIYSGAAQETSTCNVDTSEAERGRFCLSDAEVLQLADYAIKVEAHYSAKAGRDRPMDVEWAKDGLDGRLYLVQARPETVVSRRQGDVLEEFVLRGEGPVLATGRAVGTKIAAGAVHVITDPGELARFQPGEVLVADTTTPDWEPVMKQAAAIVTARGGRTCHAAIVARELGIPAIVGVEGVMDKVSSGQAVTVSCAEGDVGKLYEGALPFEVLRTDLSQLQRPKTRIMINIANPELAFQTSFIPNDGVGLARMEFIINAYIKAHPMALLHPERVADPAEREAILALARHHERPADFFVERLAEGVGTIAAAFYPKPVVVRMSDFKSNEYASLLGGRAFEPREENPMLGFRGASRYTHPAYAEGFALECAAMRRVREEMGLANVKLMIPFCRRVEEGERVVAAMAEHGLRRSDKGLEIYVMCEIPNNVLQIDAFAQVFDGFSIGSNDLTQLVLGVDRDSALVAFEFDERDPGVLAMLRMTVEGARRNGRHSGICGQAPSDYPELAQYLVEAGIDSISLNPDSVLKTTLAVLDFEARQARGQEG
ncbi:phosphoenolpyruvate synthase [Thermithiobacillus tepidarius DSM 3134]|uniref:phosphoenolpyruvate synthase n=1 Tax=Thermithiobacillus tepidarius TaxID=929 RepID=UPI000423948A|nr:phosphoenolpyruvate synthase [Thermithiobacillus tepidarius]